MKLPGRTGRPGTPKNPRITPEARAEHTLLQQLSLQLGQEALRQSGIPFETTAQLTPETNLARVPHLDTDAIICSVTVDVTVNPNTTAVTRIHTK